MMHASRSGFKSRRVPTASEVAATAAQVARIAAAINSKDSWVLVTDDPAYAHGFRILAAIMVFGGTPAAQVQLCEFEVLVLDRADTISPTVLTVSKAAMPAVDVVRFVTGLTGCGPRAAAELAALASRGRDIVPLGRDPEALTVLIDRIRCNQLHFTAPITN